MADPFTIGAIAISGLISAGGALATGASTEAAGNANAAANEQSASVTRDQSRADLLIKRNQNLRLASETRATYGASGLAFDGSALDYFEDQAADMELDARLTTYAGSVKAGGYQRQAQLDRMGAKSARSASYIGALGELGQAGASVAKLKRV